jgi:tripartite-type tricarboxylate transporter receptor subunit TctC
MRASRRSIIAGSLTLLPLLAATFGAAQADDYPTHPIRIITDSAAGSALDVPERIIADEMSRVLGQQAVVINQPGAGGAIAVRAAAAAAPDGYTLGMASVSAFVAAPGTAENLPIQVPRDLIPVGYLGGAPMFINAAPFLGLKTLPDLIAAAKQKPGELSYGVNGIGRLTHLTGELLQRRGDFKLLMVPYTGATPQILNDMMGKRVGLLFEAYSGLAGAIDAKTIIPLAVASASRMPGFPDLPTVAETLPGFESIGWQVLLAPPGTPDDVVQKLNAALAKAMRVPEARKRLIELGRDDRTMSSAETLAFIQQQQQTWAPIVEQIAAKQ